jgi:hypothetical protein
MTQRTTKVRNRALVAVIATALSAPSSARAQNVGDAVEPAEVQAERAPFAMVRYLEDRLARAGAPRDAWKDIQLLDGLRVSFGGQHRLRYEYITFSRQKSKQVFGQAAVQLASGIGELHLGGRL